MLTYAEALDVHQIAVPDHLVAQAEVPVLAGTQRQGDLLIRPTTMPATTPVPRSGVQLVVGEETGNTHWLDGPGVCFDRRDGGRADPLLGVVTVPDGRVGYVTHTDEHGANAVAPGSYEIRRARVQATEVMLVAD